MGAVKLEISCPQNVNGVALDPNPDWSFEALLSEIDSLEKKLNDSSSITLSNTKTKSRLDEKKTVQRSPNAFVMRVSDDELEDLEDADDEDKYVPSAGSITSRRFNCEDLYLSDDSDDESDLELQPYMMNEIGLVEVSLFELTHEHQLGVKEEIRNKISLLEAELLNETEKSTSACARVEKYREVRQDAERKLDVLYQRKIAEALDNHLTAVQREHELKSQIEERRLRSDAAYEEAKRKEKALQEERLRQEKAKAEAEMQAKIKAEEAKRAALEAERRAAKEAAERESAKTSKTSDSVASKIGAVSNAQPTESEAHITKKSQSAGNIIRAATSALKLEQEREQKLKELDEKNAAVRSSTNQDFSSHERHIARVIKTIGQTEENVRKKSSELILILNNPSCPQTISIAIFVKKVVHQCATPSNPKFATANVIGRVISQFPYAMDLLLAELHRACIYTIPKHISHVESAFESKEAYCKAIGYRVNDDGGIESTEDFLQRLESYMKLYGALVQTEVPGFQNIHGLTEGWAWLARLLNTLPANKYTVVAMNSFLQMAGFSLYRKFKPQFLKMLSIISDNFLPVLRAREDPELKQVTLSLQTYIKDKVYLQEPVGRTFQASSLSSALSPDADYQDHSYHQQPSGGYQHSYHQQPRGGYQNSYHQSNRYY